MAYSKFKGIAKERSSGCRTKQKGRNKHCYIEIVICFSTTKLPQATTVLREGQCPFCLLSCTFSLNATVEFTTSMQYHYEVLCISLVQEKCICEKISHTSFPLQVLGKALPTGSTVHHHYQPEPVFVQV